MTQGFKLTPEEKATILNLSYLGVKVIKIGESKAKKEDKKKKSKDEVSWVLSRYVPKIKSVSQVLISLIIVVIDVVLFISILNTCYFRHL